MGSKNPESANQNTSEKILGYLNFSSGVSDPTFVSCVDQVFANLAQTSDSDSTTANHFHQWLKSEIETHQSYPDAKIKNFDQALAVIDLVFENILPSYLRHHKDLLFHQNEEFLFNSFFIARVLENVLKAGSPWDDAKRIKDLTLAELNNFLGHRPVATLESQKIEPYEHEWIAPVPVYLQDVGTAQGRYRELIEIAIGIFKQTSPVILREACFSLERLDEIAIDPRAFDFDHPINKRPNHHFGQWDAHNIGEDGFFHRFIIHQVTLDSLLNRIERKWSQDDDQYNRQLMIEGGAVLAWHNADGFGYQRRGPRHLRFQHDLGNAVADDCRLSRSVLPRIDRTFAH